MVPRQPGSSGLIVVMNSTGTACCRHDNLSFDGSFDWIYHDSRLPIFQTFFASHMFPDTIVAAKRQIRVQQAKNDSPPNIDKV